MSNKPDDSHGFFMERLLKLCPRIFEGSEIDLRPCGELLTLCSSLVRILANVVVLLATFS